MKFVCHNCKAKYTISDAKVRKKRLKIRCRNCNAIIKIADPALGDTSSIPPSAFSSSSNDPKQRAAARSDESAVPQQAMSSLEEKFAGSFGNRGAEKPAGTPGLLQNLQQAAETMEKDEVDHVIWFAALDDAPAGPLTCREIHRYRKVGRVADSTLIWKEGMANWAPLRNVKELVGLLARLDLENAVSSSPQGISHRLGLFNTAAAAKEHDPLRGAHVGVLEERPASIVLAPRKDEVALPAKPFAAKTSSVFENLGTESSKVHSLSPPRTRGNRVYVLASVGFFITALVTLGIVLFGGGQAGGEPQSVKTVEKIVEKVVYRDRAPTADDSLAKSADDGEKESQAAAADSTTSMRNKKSTQKKKPVDDKTKELMDRLGVSTPDSRALIGGRSAGDELGTAAESGRTDGLNANQMKRVVNSNKEGLKNCYERSLKKGEASDNRDLRVNFKIVVGMSGIVKKTALSGEGAKLSSLNECLTQSVKRWVFPSSDRESNLEFPFVFTPMR